MRFGQEMIPSDHLTNDEFWQRAAKSDEPPGTSSPAPGTFLQAFQKLVDAGHDVVCLTLPGKHSGTFNAAWLAAEEFGDRVRVVDTGSFSLGMGLQVLESPGKRSPGAARSSSSVLLKACAPARRSFSCWTRWNGCAAAAGWIGSFP